METQEPKLKVIGIYATKWLIFIDLGDKWSLTAKAYNPEKSCWDTVFEDLPIQAYARSKIALYALTSDGVENVWIQFGALEGNITVVFVHPIGQGGAYEAIG